MLLGHSMNLLWNAHVNRWSHCITAWRGLAVSRGCGHSFIATIASNTAHTSWRWWGGWERRRGASSPVNKKQCFDEKSCSAGCDFLHYYILWEKYTLKSFRLSFLALSLCHCPRKFPMVILCLGWCNCYVEMYCLVFCADSCESVLIHKERASNLDEADLRFATSPTLIVFTKCFKPPPKRTFYHLLCIWCIRWWSLSTFWRTL